MNSGVSAEFALTCLKELQQMRKFKMYDDNGNVVIEAEDLRYNLWSAQHMEEGIVSAYFFFRGQIEGKRFFDEQMRIFADQKAKT